MNADEWKVGHACATHAVRRWTGNRKIYGFARMMTMTMAWYDVHFVQSLDKYL